MTFGEALEQAKQGRRIERAGWNGRNMWVCFMGPCTIPEDMVNYRTKPFVPTGDLHVGGYFVMMTAQGIWQPGWLASQTDLIADDWSRSGWRGWSTRSRTVSCLGLHPSSTQSGCVLRTQRSP